MDRRRGLVLSPAGRRTSQGSEVTVSAATDPEIHPQGIVRPDDSTADTSSADLDQFHSHLRHPSTPGRQLFNQLYASFLLEAKIESSESAGSSTSPRPRSHAI